MGLWTSSTLPLYIKHPICDYQLHTHLFENPNQINPNQAMVVEFLLVSLLLSPIVVSGYKSEDVKSWCSQTPYPQPCEYFLSHKPDHSPIKQKSDFLKISMQLALERALRAESNTYSLGSKCRNELEKTAWSDCLKLYEYTILRLNKTVDPNTKCSQVDSQTWLSTALTNLETCRAGFVELGVSDYLLPLMSNNVSKLISNTLSLNKVPYTEPSYKEGFPTWVKPGDRKLLQSSSPASQANIVVAKDGSGDYTTITAAVSAASKRSGTGRYVIYVKAGTYNENIEIGAKLKNIMLLGDGIGKTIITGSKSVGGGSTTFNSATVAAVGDGFIGRGLTIRNTAGAANHQAVALRSGSDLSVFYQCSFEGYQDTLYVHSERQFYREYLKSVQSSVKTYLGRPWKEYSRTVFMKTYLDSLINPAGWMEWSGNFALKTLYYGEYMNTGPGSSTSNRVNWAGYHVITSSSEASKFTVGNFIAGNSWLPATNVPFTSGL
ncbi:Pectinesterase 2 [Vitis vinifera]|uniref:Pectinesterase n=1 Tax=Vitis vinifera TaxID=29760 RepID=A0A438E003_VITVI|nr:Pectinesterase 2 [Vitis vinifera]